MSFKKILKELIIFGKSKLNIIEKKINNNSDINIISYAIYAMG